MIFAAAIPEIQFKYITYSLVYIGLMRLAAAMTDGNMMIGHSWQLSQPFNGGTT